MEKKCSYRIKMRPEVSFMSPSSVLENNNGIIRRNVRLIKDKCLFLGGDSLMLPLL